MSERNEEIEQQIHSTEWYMTKAVELSKRYDECPTMFGQSKLLPQLQAMIGKIQFQLRELKKYRDESQMS